MALIKCKMCGGDIELSGDKTFGTCEYCGSIMTFPKIDDEQRAAAFNRGNHFRRIGEFDKALAVYERIVREDETDAEAHWCCALCRFGIEYVEDPTTYEYVPTCHRASFDSFLEDVDYLAALEYSDGVTRRQYQKDGVKIAEVQKGILATSQNAQAYDVFICYKETDALGERTRDSMLAQDIYYQLTEQGRRVFFSRITLEDVVGSQYEPYIFAALNSAKVMIVVGTNAEHLNAVWVKNEWSRFLAMMKKDHSKLLLPCYRDMDPYDLPEQLSVLQSYDMSKIGFIQDLIRGVAKVLDVDKKPGPVHETPPGDFSGGPSVHSLMQRVWIFLEDGDFDNADAYCEKVLDMQPENAYAYVGKLLVQLRIRGIEDLGKQTASFSENSAYKRALRYADPSLYDKLSGYAKAVDSKEEEKRQMQALAAQLAREEARKREAQEEERQQKEALAALRARKEARDKAALEAAQVRQSVGEGTIRFWVKSCGPLGAANDTTFRFNVFKGNQKQTYVDVKAAAKPVSKTVTLPAGQYVVSVELFGWMDANCKNVINTSDPINVTLQRNAYLNIYSNRNIFRKCVLTVNG